MDDFLQVRGTENLFECGDEAELHEAWFNYVINLHVKFQLSINYDTQIFYLWFNSFRIM